MTNATQNIENVLFTTIEISPEMSCEGFNFFHTRKLKLIGQYSVTITACFKKGSLKKRDYVHMIFYY